MNTAKSKSTKPSPKPKPKPRDLIDIGEDVRRRIWQVQAIGDLLVTQDPDAIALDGTRDSIGHLIIDLSKSIHEDFEAIYDRASAEGGAA